MSEDGLQSLVEQRIAQLTEISSRRNALLRQMYNMMRKRNNVGATLAIDEEEEDDLHVFLVKHDLHNNSNTTFIGHLSENELFSLVSPQEPSSIPSHLSQSPPDPRSQSPIGLEEPSSPVVSVTPEFAAENTEGDPNPHSPLPSHEPPVVSVIPISSSPEPSQQIAVRSPENSSISAPITTDDSQDAVVPNPASPLESVLQGETTHEEPSDAMDIDKPVQLPLSPSSSLLEAFEDAQLPNRASPTILNQPHIAQEDVAPLLEVHMDVDVEPSQNNNLQISLTQPAPVEIAKELEPEPDSHSEPAYARAMLPTVSPADFFLGDVPSAPPVFIPVPSSPFRGSSDDFKFSTVLIEPPSAPPKSPLQPRYKPDFRYSLPPLDALPADFRPKGKRAKQKKREKDRDGRKDKEGKDDSIPWGINRWNATIRTNPVYKRVAKSTKCLSTREWDVAMTELQVIRAVDRIELLKSNGRWSFRQPKKQRASGGITKTHWDYLMDEMKWMRTDFREERKWKMALAYNLSTAVLEWHVAGTTEKRLKRGICVHWKPPQPDDPKDQVMEDIVEAPADLAEPETPYASGPTRPSSALLNLDYGSDDEDDEDQDKEVDDALDPSAMVEESLASIGQNSIGDGVGLKDLQPKTEEVDDTSALQSDNMNVHNPTSFEAAEPLKTESNSVQTFGLKSTSDDPMLPPVSTSTSQSSERSSIPHSKSSKISLYAPLREKIAYSEVDKLFLDLDDFRITIKNRSTDDLKESFLPPSSLSDIFPDTQPYGMFDVATSTVPPADGRRKSEKKSDRDDVVNKRIDEVAYSKLYPASTFMLFKPALVSALQPSKHIRNGQWVDLDQTPISVEHDSPQQVRLPEEFNQGIFEHKVVSAAIVASSVPSVQQTAAQAPPKFKEPSKRVVEHGWSASDDILLKSLAEKYPNNWGLVAECYNASKVTVKSDWRSPKDCQDRWRGKWSLAATQKLVESESALEVTPPPPNTPAAAEKRGVKRPASSSVSMSSAPVISTSLSTGFGSEPRKRRRHATVQDAVRKSIKKKNEAAQKNSARKFVGMHESHNEYANLVKMSPAEISRRKAERDMQQSQEVQLARARALAGPNGANVRSSVSVPQPAAGQGNVNGSPRPSVPGVPAQPVAQIRSQPVQQVPISQQQRAGTPLISGNSRMSPQQQHQQLLAQQVQRTQAQNASQGLTPQTQAQVQAQIALLQAQAVQGLQGHAAIQALVQNGGVAVNGNSQLLPTSSTQASPPRTSGTPSNGTTGAVHSPRPASAQAQSQGSPAHIQAQAQPQVGLLQNGQIAGMSIPQARTIQGHYFLPNTTNGLTPEQLQSLRLQMAQYAQQPQFQQQPQ